MRFKGLKTEVFRLAAPLGLWAKAAPRPMGRPMGSSEAPMPVDLASRMLEPEDTGEPLSMPSHKAKRHQVVNSTSFYTPWHLGLLLFVRGASCIEDAIRGMKACDIRNVSLGDSLGNQNKRLHKFRNLV